MNALNLSRLNTLSPYMVIPYHNEYLFRSDYGIEYVVGFKTEDIFNPIPAYWFDLSNRSQKASPNDAKVRETVICIILEFFQENPDIMLYMCDSANDQQAQRNRLFLRWFSGAKQSQQFFIKTDVIVDEGMENFIAIIVPRQHPYLEEIVSRYNAEIEMFKSSK